MGWLEGVLTGYADRHYEIQKEKMREAQVAAEREGRVYQALLNSGDDELKALAGAGILDLANPRRRKGGIAGWMGEIEQSPYLEMIRRVQQRPVDDPEAGGSAPPTPSIPTAGSVPGQPSAALPEKALTEGGTGIAPTPAPIPGSVAPPRPQASFAPGVDAGSGATSPPVSFAPPTPPGVQAAQAAGAAPPQAGPSMAPAGGPPPPPPAGPVPTPGQVGRGQPGAVTQAVGPQAPVPSSRTTLRPIFPTQSELTQQDAVARAAGTDLGEQQSYIRVARAQGLSDAEGLQMWAEAQMKARGGAGAASPYAWRTMEYTDAQGNRKRILARTNRTTGAIEDVNGQPLPANAQPVTPGLYPAEVAARRQAQNPLLWNQALTQARSVLGVNATAEEVIDFADQLFTQSQSMAPTGSGGAVAPPPTTVPPPGGAPPVAPGATPQPGEKTFAQNPAGAPPASATAPEAAPPATPVAPPSPTAPGTPGAALKEGLAASGAGNSLTRRRDEGRPATSPEKDILGFYLRARQPMDAIMAPDKETGLSVEDRIASQPLGQQLARRFTPDTFDFLLGADAQLYKTASERFTEARVRRVSGATIRPDEYEMDRKLFFAQPGDTKERIAEKRRQREAELDAAVFASGPAYNEYFKQPYTPSFMREDPRVVGRLPPAMPPPPVNRAVPRPPSGLPTPVPSHGAAPPPPPAAAGAPAGTPTSVFRDGKWYIVIQ